MSGHCRLPTRKLDNKKNLHRDRLANFALLKFPPKAVADLGQTEKSVFHPGYLRKNETRDDTPRNGHAMNDINLLDHQWQETYYSDDILEYHDNYLISTSDLCRT